MWRRVSNSRAAQRGTLSSGHQGLGEGAELNEQSLGFAKGRALWANASDGSTTVWMYWCPWIVRSNMIKAIIFVFCVFCHNLKYNIKTEDLYFKGNAYLSRTNPLFISVSITWSVTWDSRPGIRCLGKVAGVSGEKYHPYIIHSREFTGTILK